MRKLSLFGAILLSLPFLLPSISGAQESVERKFKTTEIVLYYSVKDESGVEERTLWVTTDEGATWRKAEQERVEWSEGVGGRTRVRYRAPSDGRYGFVFQFKDALSNATPAPNPGEKPKLVAVVETGPEILPLDKVLEIPTKDFRFSSRVHSLRIPYALKKGLSVATKELWMTRDNGANWERVNDVEWIESGETRAMVISVKEDGAYGFALELSDGKTYAVPAPRSGEAPHCSVKVENAPPALAAADLIDLPKAGQKFTASSRAVRLPYQTHPGAEIAEKELWITADGGKSWGTANGVEWSTATNGATFVRFEVPADGAYGLAFRFVTRDGRATAASYGATPHCWVTVTTAVVAAGRPILLKPKGGEEWIGGQVVVLQWMSPNGYREKSAALHYSMDGGPWVLITKGLETMGFYRWAPPSKSTAKLRIKVTMLDGAGKEIASDPSGDIVVVIPSSPDVASAKRHFYQGTLRRAQRKYDESIISYEKALETWDTYPEALNDVAFVHYEQGDYGKALEYFLRAKAVNRGSASASANVGFALLRLGLAGDALRELETAVAVGMSDRRLQSKVSLALLETARALAGAGDAEGAARACRLILDIPASDAETRKLAEEMSKAPGK